MSSVELIENESLVINEESFYAKEGSLFFLSNALTESFVPLEVLKRDAWTFKGKELRFRHKIPEEDVNALIGHIHDAYIEDDKLVLLSELWGYKEELKELQEQVKEGKLSISAGYKKTEQNGEIVAIYGRELSLTPTPKCTKKLGCGISTIVQNEVKKMPDKFEEALTLLEKTLKTQNTERGERIVELESTIDLMEGKIHETNENLVKLEDENKKLKEKIQALEKDQKESSTLALRNEIVKLEGIIDSKAVEEEIKKLSENTPDQLKDLKERLERTRKISLKENRGAPMLGEDNEQNQSNDIDSNISPEELASRLNPSLKNYLSKAKAPAPPEGFQKQ